MQNPKQWILQQINEARVAWGLDEQWLIGVKWVEKSKLPDNPPAAIRWDPVSKRATLELVETDPATSREDELQPLIYHEIGHIAISVSWARMEHWICNYSQMLRTKKELALFQEMANFVEEDIIDYIVHFVLKKGKRGTPWRSIESN